jgi:heptaprenylglyceryl phosphate synthase
VADIVTFMGDHSTAVMIGAAVGVVSAKVLHMIQRVKRLLLLAIVLAVAGGSGVGGASSILGVVTSLR